MYSVVILLVLWINIYAIKGNLWTVDKSKFTVTWSKLFNGNGVKLAKEVTKF